MSVQEILDHVEQVGGGPKLKAFILGVVLTSTMIGVLVSGGMTWTREVTTNDVYRNRVQKLEDWRADQERFNSQIDHKVTETQTDVKWIREYLSRAGGK